MKDPDLLYSTVEVFVELTGWKPCPAIKNYIRCSFYKKPDENERKCTSSPSVKHVSGQSRSNQV